jgi:hypothetical protein
MSGESPSDTAPQTALVHRPEVESAPVIVKLARTFDEAGPDSLVIIDRHGDLIPLWRLRALSILSRAAGMTLFVMASIVMIQWAGILGLGVPVALGLLSVSRRARWATQWRISALIQAGRLDEAEALCGFLVQRRARRPLQAWVHRSLAIIESRRGHHASALEQVRAALRRVAVRRDASTELLAYQEIRLLCDVGQIGEARARLESRKDAERGEVVVVQRWLTELYVQFFERKLTLDEEELWTRSQRALKLSGGAPLLALCAWAFAERRDDDMATHLVEQAVDRFVPWMRLAAPVLWKWVEERLGRPVTVEGVEGELAGAGGDE